MTRFMHHAVLPPVQSWLRRHASLSIYIAICVVAWAIAVGVTR